MTRREATLELCVGECGSACCRTPAQLLRVRHDELERMLRLASKKKLPAPTYRQATIDRFGPLYEISMGAMGRCVFLQHSTGLCRIYAARPNCCRVFPHQPFRGCLVWPDDGTARFEVGPGEPREVPPDDH